MKPETKPVYTSKSDGIYIGLSGQTKRTWEIMYGEPMGRLMNAFGQFLAEEYKSSYNQDEADDLKKRIKDEFSHHGHSGGSALVEIQQLFDLLGARCLDENTRKYLLDLKAMRFDAKKEDKTV